MNEQTVIVEVVDGRAKGVLGLSPGHKSEKLCRAYLQCLKLAEPGTHIEFWHVFGDIPEGLVPPPGATTLAFELTDEGWQSSA